MKKRVGFSIIIILAVLVIFAGLVALLPTEASESANADAGQTIINIDSIDDYNALSHLLSANTIISINCDLDMSLATFSITNVNCIIEGNGHYILNAKEPFISSLMPDGIIRNLSFFDFDYTKTSGGAAPVVNSNSGLVENISVHGSLTARSAGGIVNLNAGTVKNCDSYVDIVSNSSYYAGGIAAINSGKIENSRYFGNIFVHNPSTDVIPSFVGGIAGQNQGEITKCSAFSGITLKGYIDSNAGGITGMNGMYTLMPVVDPDTEEVTYTDSYTEGTVSSSFFIGSINTESLLLLDGSPAIAGGGIAGRLVSGRLKNSYSHLQGNADSYGILGRFGMKTLFGEGRPEDKTDAAAAVYGCFSVTKDMEASAVNVGYTLDPSNAIVTENDFINAASGGLSSKLGATAEVGTVWLNQTNAYPIVEGTVLSGQGSTEAPLSVGSITDWYRLQAFSQYSAGYHFAQARDLDFSHIRYAPISDFSGNYDARGFAFSFLDAESLFLNVSGDFVNVGFLLSKSGICVSAAEPTQHTAYYEATDFGYNNSGFLSVDGEQPTVGDGTADAPYLITKKEHLKYIDNKGDGAYFKLGASILLNDLSVGKKYQLQISSFGGYLDGDGYEIVGLSDEAFIGTLTGTVKNLKVRGHMSVGYGAFAVGTATELALVERVTAFGLSSGTSCAGLVYINSGTVTDCINYASLTHASSAGIAYTNRNSVRKCENYGQAGVAIARNDAESLASSISDCINYYYGLPLYNGVGTLNSSVNVNAASGEDAVSAWHDGEELFSSEKIGAGTLFSLGCFSTATWKYYMGQDESYPCLNFSGRFFKRNTDAVFVSAYASADRTFNNTQLVTKQTVESASLKNQSFAASVSFVWYYAKDELPAEDADNILPSGTSVKNAGYYRLVADYPGSDTVHSARYVYELTVKKAVLPSPIFGAVNIEGLTSQNVFYYTGDSYDIWQIKPSNYADYGFDAGCYGYAVTGSGGNTISEIAAGSTEAEREAFSSGIIAAGTYTVSVLIVSDNYNTVSGQVSITVTRTPLSVNVADKSINYLEEAGELSYSLVLTVKSGTEEERRAELEQRAALAVTSSGINPSCSDYSVGADAKDYVIDMPFSSTNYNVTVNKGKLTVKKLDLTEEYLFETRGIAFEKNQTKTYNGYSQVADIELPSDISVVFSQGTYKDVATYAFTATFSKSNYNSIAVSVGLEITPAALTLRPNDLTVGYGEARAYSLIPPQFLGDDTMDSLSGTAVFSSNYADRTEDGVRILDDCGTYTVSVSGFTSQNYDITYASAVLTVVPVKMTGLFDYPDGEYFYDGSEKTHPIYTGSYSPKIVYTSTLDGNGESIFKVGVYDVSAVVTKINNNYLDTTFSCTVEVKKGVVSTSQVYYKASYTKDFDGERGYIPYEGTLPEAEGWTVQYTYKNNASSESSDYYQNAGGYSVTAAFSGNDNYNAFERTTVLTVNPKGINIKVSGSKAFGNVFRTPDVEIVEDIGDAEVGFTFTYGYVGFVSQFSEIKNAGIYEVYATSENGNYAVKNVPLFEIKKLAVEYTPRVIEYTYGDYGKRPIDYVSYTIERTHIIHHEFRVQETNERVNVTYYYGSHQVGIFDVTSCEELSNYTFYLSAESGQSKVVIRKRELSVSWNTGSASVVYSGKVQAPFSATLGNNIDGDMISYEIAYDGNRRDVGTHTASVSLIASNLVNANYSVPASHAVLTVTPAPLEIKAKDILVQMAAVPQYGYTFGESAGLQNGETLSDLGVSVNYICAYTEYTAVGARLPIDIQPFTLKNYSITFSIGYLTVTERSYPLATLPSKTFTYDGSPKGLTFGEELPTGAIPNFTGNYQTNVGEYAVTASVWFPDGTVQQLSATLKITKATPVVVASTVHIPFFVSNLDVAKLQNFDIIGSSTLNNKEVLGSFSWTGSTDLKKGTNLYRARFVPDDVQNLNSVDFDVTVVCEQVKTEVLLFDIPNIVIVEGKLMKTEEEATMTLADTYPGLTMLIDGEEVESFLVPDSGTFSLELRFREHRIYAIDLTVETVTEPAPPVEIDWTGGHLVLENGVLENGNKIIASEGCTLRIDEQYSAIAYLFVDGKLVQSALLTGDEKSIDVKIRHNGVLVYSQTFSVEKVKVDEEEEPTDNWLWLKVTGGIAGGVLLIVGAFIVIKKLRERKAASKLYNPYEEAESKNDKKKY